MIRFVVPGQPVAWARARARGRQRFTAPEQAAWMQACLRAAWLTGLTPPPGRLVVEIDVVLERPAAKPKTTTTQEWATGHQVAAIGRCDVDNHAKIVLDALHPWMGDDRRVVQIAATKWHGAPGEAPHVAVIVAAWVPR